MKLWLNGHEWAKRQVAKRGIAFTALDNGFLACNDPLPCRRSAHSAPATSRLPGPVDPYLPLPLTRRRVRFGYRLSLLQMEVGRTQVFDRCTAGSSSKR
jgi:hypothetical protein